MNGFLRQFVVSFPARDRRPIYEWAHDHLTNPPTLAQDKNRHFDVSTSRHFLSIFDALKSDRVREVNLMAPPRSGKSLIADVFVPWVVCEDPCGILWILQDEAMANSHAELRAMPTLKSVAQVRAMLPSNCDKERLQEIIFSNGLPLIMTGPALGKLQSRGFKVVVLDEAWIIADKYPGRIEEAKNRLGDFTKQFNSKFFCVSQGGEQGSAEQGNDWAVQFDSGALHEWNIQCAGCTEWFTPEWSGHRSDGSRWGMVYDAVKDERGKRNVARAIETLRYVCPACGHGHIDSAKVKRSWNATGKYVCAETPGDKVSFHWNRITEWPWANMVESWIKAQAAYDTGYNIPLIQFYQKELARNYDPAKAERIYKLPACELSALDGDKFWEKQDRIFFTVDVQQDHFWGLVTAWSNTGELMVLWFGQLYSWPDVLAKQVEFKVIDQCVFVDAGQGARQSEIYSECTKHGHFEIVSGARRWCSWWAMKGKDRDLFPDETRKDSRSGKCPLIPYSWPPMKGDPCIGLHATDPLLVQLRGKFCNVIYWSNPTVKDIAKRRRDEMAKGERSLIAKGDWNETFSAHLHSEKPKQVVDRFGHKSWKWTVIGKRPNHGWDCFCMAVTAAAMANCLGDLSVQG